MEELTFDPAMIHGSASNNPDTQAKIINQGLTIEKNSPGGIGKIQAEHNYKATVVSVDLLKQMLEILEDFSTVKRHIPGKRKNQVQTRHVRHRPRTQTNTDR